MYTALLLSLTIGLAQPGGPAGRASGSTHYAAGLDALERGDWQAAITSFSLAIDQDEDSPDYHLARGVARVLAEKFPEAQKDLQRALKLRDADWETRLWLSAAYFMNDEAEQGSMHFSHGREDTHEYAEVVQEMARVYMTSRYRGSYYDMARREQVDTTEPVRTNFPRAAAAFVRRHRTGAAAAATTLETAKSLFEAGRFAEALGALELLRAASPDDLTLLEYHAGASLGVGDAVTARSEFTQLLTANPDSASGYFGRARAAAMMGDVSRAKADLELACKLDPGSAERFRSDAQLQKLSAMAAPDPGAIHALQSKLLEQARGDAGWEPLLASAGELVRAVEATRRRADEAYQARFQVLLEATRRIPATASSFADLGAFLYQEATGLRGEAVEPRAEFATYRPSSRESVAAELKRAEQNLDAALKMDADHVKALTYKAGCLIARLQWGDAESVVKRALSLKPDDPELLAMFSRIMDHAAAVRAAKAAQLRAVESWEDMSYIYWRHPSQAELDQADLYDRQAEQLWKLAAAHLEAAAKAAQGTAQGFFYEGIIARRKKDPAAARAALEQAVKLAPDKIEARDELVNVYAGLGMTVEAYEQQSAANNLVHTTAGPMLRLAWIETSRTARKGARAAANKAMALDPADPRCTAYLGIVETDAEKYEEAAAYLRAALAVIETRARLHGQSLEPTASGPIDDLPLGQGLAVKLKLAAALRLLGRCDAALEVFRSAVALEPRIPEEQQRRELVSAMLPDPAAESHRLPETDPPVALFAAAHVELGNAALAANELDEAERHFEIVRRDEASWPATRRGRERLFEPAAWARLGMVKVLAARGRYDEAFRLIMSEGLPGNVPESLQKEMQQLQEEISRRRMGE